MLDYNKVEDVTGKCNIKYASCILWQYSELLVVNYKEVSPAVVVLRLYVSMPLMAVLNGNHSFHYEVISLM